LSKEVEIRQRTGTVCAAVLLIEDALTEIEKSATDLLPVLKVKNVSSMEDIE